MKNHHILAILSAIIIVLSIVFDMALAANYDTNNSIENVGEETTINTEPPETEAPETEPPKTEITPEEYTSPIDFQVQYQTNEHIYSWMKITNTTIDYPILQHPTDKTFYNRRDVNKNYSVYGSIFTEFVYNTTDFSDPVTLIYGHHTYNGLMFGDLQAMYKEELETYKEIVVYLPEKELHYEVFAAVVHDDLHILYYNDFTDPEVFNSFFGKVFEKSGYRDVINKDCVLTPEDKVIILSTCLDGNPSHRYLVMAKLVDVVE